MRKCNFSCTYSIPQFANKVSKIKDFHGFNLSKSIHYIVIDGNPDEYARAGEHVYFIDPEQGFTPTDAKKAAKLLSRLDKKKAG